MKLLRALAIVSLTGVVRAGFEHMVPRKVTIEEGPVERMAQCPTCCTETLRRITIKETFYSTETETVYKTSTVHDVSTDVQYTTAVVTKEQLSVYTTTLPVTVTSLINCTKRPQTDTPTPTLASYKKRTSPLDSSADAPLECDTVTTTEWRATTTTTTLTDIETVTQTCTSEYPVTVTSEHDVTSTETATTIKAIVTTVTTSYPLPATTTTVQRNTTTTVTACPVPTNASRGGGGGATPLDPRSNLTFGCPPGTVCIPPKPVGCDVWAAPPPDTYVCQPSECAAAPAFTLPLWGDSDRYYYYPPSRGYFNLNPASFGLSCDIFAAPGELKNETGHGPGYLAGAIMPPQCFDDCNNAYVVAEANGKSEELCRDGSSFSAAFGSCKQCIQTHLSAGLGSGMLGSVAGGGLLGGIIADALGPVFDQFLNFCKGRRSVSVTTALPPPPPPSNSVTSTPEGPESAVLPTPVMSTNGQQEASSASFNPVPGPTTAAAALTTQNVVPAPSSSAPAVAVPGPSSSSSTAAEGTSSAAAAPSVTNTASGPGNAPTPVADSPATQHGSADSVPAHTDKTSRTTADATNPQDVPTSEGERGAAPTHSAPANPTPPTVVVQNGAPDQPSSHGFALVCALAAVAVILV